MRTVELNRNSPLKDKAYSTSQNTIALPRHRWYVIKEGFSPKLVEAAVEEVGISQTDRIVDPFCGSGTVPLFAAAKNLKAVGFEVNPFLAFISKVKLSKCCPDRLTVESDEVAKKISTKKKSSLEGYSTFSPNPGLSRWLFNKDVLRAFDAGWLAASHSSPRSSPLLRLALAKAAMDCCNAKADGKCLRYKKDWTDLAFNGQTFTSRFREHTALIVSDLRSDPLQNIDVSIFNRDSRRAVRQWDGPFRLCVTSPPYLNSFDYSDVYRPELFLTKKVLTNSDLRQIRLRTVRSHVQVKWQQPKRKDFGETYKTVVARLNAAGKSLWDKRIPSMVQAYFEDMESVLTGLRRSAAKEAFVWMVVSTSAYGGVEIPVDFILADIAESVGWYLRDISVLRNLRPSGHHWSRLEQIDRSNARLRESIVVLANTPKS